MKCRGQRRTHPGGQWCQECEARLSVESKRESMSQGTTDTHDQNNRAKCDDKQFVSSERVDNAPIQVKMSIFQRPSKLTNPRLSTRFCVIILHLVFRVVHDFDISSLDTKAILPPSTNKSNFYDLMSSSHLTIHRYRGLSSTVKYTMDDSCWVPPPKGRTHLGVNGARSVNQ